MEDETTLDELMREDPLKLTERKLDAIVAYHHNNRARLELTGKAGRKAARPVKDKPKLDLMSLTGSKPKEAVPSIRRRF